MERVEELKREIAKKEAEKERLIDEINELKTELEEREGYKRLEELGIDY